MPGLFLKQGTPQGGPISPLLSTIVLDELDRELESRKHRFVRYADDCAASTKTAEPAVGVRNYLTDEGRPLGTGLREQVPKHLRRFWSKAEVVNAEGKGLEPL